MATKQRKLRLTLDVTYDSHGIRVEYLKQTLGSMVERAIGDGGLTGESEAEVDEWAFKIEEIVL